MRPERTCQIETTLVRTSELRTYGRLYLKNYAPEGVDITEGGYLIFIGVEAEKLGGSPT